jgi:hypothetical protein
MPSRVVVSELQEILHTYTPHARRTSRYTGIQGPHCKPGGRNPIEQPQ